MLQVILADDEQYEREYLARILKEDYPGLLKVIDTAVDGMDLMKKLKKSKPHIILLDIKMPRMNGLEAAEEIKKKYPDIQIVVISAYSDFDFAKKALKLGVTDYLLKPYLDSELRETLDKVIARAREREDSLDLLSYGKEEENTHIFDFYRDLEKDFLWKLFFERITEKELKKQMDLWEIGNGWMKVVLIFSPALVSMGKFSQEVLKNYFHMPQVKVLNSIWLDQMAIFLYSEEEDAFTDLTGCIRRARDYLAGETKIPVACGVSGICTCPENLPVAYEEAARYISEYYGTDIHKDFLEKTEGMKEICYLEEQISNALAERKKKEGEKLFTTLIEALENYLMYQDVAVKLNFGRSLMTIMREVNQMPGIRIKTSEAISRFEKLGQLNFNGDNLKYYVDYFAAMELERE